MRRFDRNRPRRPLTPALVALYEQGELAATDDARNPYLPPQRRGDELRAHIWGQGYEDRITQEAINNLV